MRVRGEAGKHDCRRDPPSAGGEEGIKQGYTRTSALSQADLPHPRESQPAADGPQRSLEPPLDHWRQTLLKDFVEQGSIIGSSPSRGREQLTAAMQEIWVGHLLVLCHFGNITPRLSLACWVVLSTMTGSAGTHVTAAAACPLAQPSCGLQGASLLCDPARTGDYRLVTVSQGRHPW